MAVIRKRRKLSLMTDLGLCLAYNYAEIYLRNALYTKKSINIAGKQY